VLPCEKDKKSSALRMRFAVKTADPVLRNIAGILEDPSRSADLLNAFPTLVWLADRQGHCSFVNQAWEDYTGRHVEQERGTRWLESVHPDDRLALERSWSEALGLRRSFEGVYRLRRAAGDYGWIQHSAVPVNDEDGRLAGYLGTCHDVTRERESEARIQFLAHHDTLTGLPNRALLLDRLPFILAGAKRRNTHVGVLFIDLDNFKTVNDTLGHSAGDQLLRVVADRIKASLRSGDSVARLGGDEFLVVLPDLENEQAASPVADKLIASISQPMALDGQIVSTSPSIGISLFPRDGVTPDALIKSADIAMYLAKERGRANHQFYNERLAQTAFKAIALEAKLREAIREEAFVLHYQPQQNVITGAVTGIEALIRWPQPEGNFIEPGEFIPIAEQRGLMMPIGSWVLRQACRQNRAWHLAGLPKLPVAVNLSMIQFRQKHFVAEIEKALAESQLEPQYLAFELTESMLIGDTDELARTLKSLKSLGVQLSIDDFGTGHSSLMNLKRFPIDKLKVDRTFVHGIPANPDDVAIVSAIIDLARNLGITSIAEGVDRTDQLDFLRAHGCEEMQGYLMSRPLPPAEFAAWLAKPHTGTIISAQIA
jgi:diguanylate cyclase (GGDEF)-like protein/PAS domain S-box-containing protein